MSLQRIRGFTITLLRILNEIDIGVRTMELRELTGKSVPYLNRYLRNMERYGFVAKRSGFWFLTPKGKETARYFDEVESLRRLR